MKLHYVYYAIKKDGTPKVGATHNIDSRLRSGKYQSIKPLEEYDCPWKCGDREIELQLQYFGKRDSNTHYAVLIKMGIRSLSKEKQLEYCIKGGKAVAGSKNGRAKISEDDVRFIRKNYYHTNNQYAKLPKGKMTTKQLMNKFNITKSTFHRIIQGESWKHVK